MKKMIMVVCKQMSSLVLIATIFATANMLVCADSELYGQWGYIYNVNGYSYKMRNYVGCGESVLSNVEIHCLSGVAPAGYVGVQARLFTDDGVLVAYTNWHYNSSPVTSYSALTFLIFGVSGEAYYSDGITKAWNGTGYWTYGGVPTPCLNY